MYPWFKFLQDINMMDVFEHAVECETIIYSIFILKVVVIVMMHNSNYIDTIFCVLSVSVFYIARKVLLQTSILFHI